MSELSERRIKEALYIAVMNKLAGELSELEAREIMLVNGPTYITSKDHDHADHVEELKDIIMEKVDIREALKDVKSLFNQSNISPIKNEKKTDS